MSKRSLWVGGVALAAGLAAAAAVAEESGRVAVGQEGPNFTLSAAGAGDHTLSALRGEKNAVLVFFRGSW